MKPIPVMPRAHLLLASFWLLLGLPASARAADPSTERVYAAVASGATVSDLLERAREIRFESGTLKLITPSLSFLEELALALSREPSARLEILVHTADSGDPKRDLVFSKRRADVIKSALVEKGAIQQQLQATGRGSEDPVAPNLTRTGRMRNERVELHRMPGRTP